MLGIVFLFIPFLCLMRHNFCALPIFILTKNSLRVKIIISFTDRLRGGNVNEVELFDLLRYGERITLECKEASVPTY